MQTIKEYIKEYTGKSTTELERGLELILERIAFLESIYLTGGKHHSYSERFRDSAHTERQQLCQESSAIYSLLRDNE